MNTCTKIGTALLGTALAAAMQFCVATSADAKTADGKWLIYLAQSYSGNAWQSETANIIKALAATPPFSDKVKLVQVISGTDPQAQISDYESMIAAGADGVISFPISATALNKVIKAGCDKGVMFFMYDGNVTESCAYQLSYLTSGFGENTAQALVNAIGGKGKIFLDRGVPGNSVDDRHVAGAKSVFSKYPGISIVSEYYGYWDDRTTQQETAKALAAHPDVAGIWAQAGENGVILALLQANPDKLIPVTGENSNGFRLALANPDYKAKGLTGVSAGSPPAQSGIAFKMMMEILNGTHAAYPVGKRNLEYPLPWVTASEVVLCKGEAFENGCNAFPTTKVPGSFVTEVFNPKLLPELSLSSANDAKPTAGAVIQALPADAYVPAPNLPGINCNNCEASADLYKLTKVKPTVQP